MEAVDAETIVLEIVVNHADLVRVGLSVLVISRHRILPVVEVIIVAAVVMLIVQINAQMVARVVTLVAPAVVWHIHHAIAIIVVVVAMYAHLL